MSAPQVVSPLAMSPSPWIFNRRTDLAAFTAPALLGLLAVGLAAVCDLSPVAEPTWAWVLGVLLVDVAHVWSTVYVTYLDPFERARRPWLYRLTPLLCFVSAAALYQAGEAWFWRVVAYLAAFHFVRQQFGWMMMYRARARVTHRWGRIIDGTAVYAATVYPLVYWHAHLPKHFWWMKEGDFVPGLPAWVATVAGTLYGVAMAAYVLQAIADWRRYRALQPGKHLLLVTTAACWYVGIVVTNSDFAFSMTNVFIHGVPYMVLVYRYGRGLGNAVAPPLTPGLGHWLLRRGPVLFLLALWVIAYVEEWAWEQTLWHDHPGLFGTGPSLAAYAAILAPLLVTPQLMHYVLDAFLWRRSNPRLGPALRRN